MVLDLKTTTTDLDRAVQWTKLVFFNSNNAAMQVKMEVHGKFFTVRTYVVASAL